MKQSSVSRKTTSFLIYLITCAIHQIEPDKSFICETDFPALYHLAKSQSVTAITYMALEGSELLKSCPFSIAENWRKDKERAIRKNIMLDVGREEILSKMEADGIWYVPLKGCLMQGFYPVYGMRQMADNDILYDASRKKELKQLMVKLGYSIKSFDKGNHDIYQKQPIYNYEMHRDLFGVSHSQECIEYYTNVKKRLVPESSCQYGCRFTDEDFYIYITAHAHKHFETGSIGLRCLIDCYVYLLEKGNTMDWTYINTELKKLKLENFSEQCRTVTMKLFSNPKSICELNESEWEMVDFLVFCGAYGTVENFVNNKLKEFKLNGKPVSSVTRLKYYWYRIYPSNEVCKRCFPFFTRHPYLKPGLVIFRILRGIVFRRDVLKREIVTLKNLEK